MDVDIVDSVDDDVLLLNFLSDVCEEDFLPDTETISNILVVFLRN